MDRALRDDIDVKGNPRPLVSDLSSSNRATGASTSFDAVPRVGPLRLRLVGPYVVFPENFLRTLVTKTSINQNTPLMTIVPATIPKKRIMQVGNRSCGRIPRV
jgi:hypothetical protein